MKNTCILMGAVLSLGLIGCSENKTQSEPVQVKKTEIKSIQFNHLATYEYWDHLKNTDYDKIADVISSQYANEKNPNKKAKLLAELKPAIDIGLKNAQEYDDYYLLTKAELKPYDKTNYQFEDENFFITNQMQPYNPVLVDPDSKSPNVPRIFFVNSKNYQYLPSYDETLISKIEELSKANNLTEKIYFTILKSETPNETLDAEIYKIDYLDENGDIVLTRNKPIIR